MNMNLIPQFVKKRDETDVGVQSSPSISPISSRRNYRTCTRPIKASSSKSKLFVPDLCEVSDSSTDANTSREEREEREEDHGGVTGKLFRARERREKASRNLELALMDKNEQASRRALENIENKREKYRSQNSQVKKVNARHLQLETHRRTHAKKSIDFKLHQAVSRAEEQLQQKKQSVVRHTSRIQKALNRRALLECEKRTALVESLGSKRDRAEEKIQRKHKNHVNRHANRIQRAQNKRALLEFEKRTALLQSLGSKRERATRNLQLRLEDRQDKARGEIEHAHGVAKRIKAVRVLQKAVRDSFGLNDERCGDDNSNLSMTAAAFRLQGYNLWKNKVVESRLSKSNDLNSLKDLLHFIGFKLDDSASDGGFTSVSSFEALTAAIINIKSLNTIKNLLAAFHPMLRHIGIDSNATTSEAFSARTVLSVFLVAMQPDEVFGAKRGSDKCSNFLEIAANQLVCAFVKLAQVDFGVALFDVKRDIIQTVSSKILSYCTLFDKWKNADLEELVGQMTESAQQTWVAYLTCKEAVLYIEKKDGLNDQNSHFERILKYKASKKGAGSHIKRVKLAMKKLLGDEQTLITMKKAKQHAIDQIEREQLMVTIKAEIDNAFGSTNNNSSREGEPVLEKDREVDLCLEHNTSTKSTPIAPVKSTESSTMGIPKNISSNVNLVHQLLLMDDEDLKNLNKVASGCFAHFESVHTFIQHYKAHIDVSKSNGNIDDILNIKCLMVDLIKKMRKLVPRREDLHQLFTKDQVENCKTSRDYFNLILDNANIMMNFLESEHRSITTAEWHSITFKWRANSSNSIPFGFTCWKSYLSASLAFLIGKVDLCQMEIVNYQLAKVAHVVKANGKRYELDRFQKQYGYISTIESMKKFDATWKWINRIKDKDSSEELMVRVKEGFVDEILFASESFAVPEVLDQDLLQIQHFRDKACRTVISATLIIHAFKIANVPISKIDTPSMSPEATYHLQKMEFILSGFLSFADMIKLASENLTSFVNVLSSQSMDEQKIQILHNIVAAVLNGNDPVFLLMDKRMKSVFKKACKFERSSAPISMKTGRRLADSQSEVRSDVKNQFMDIIGTEVTRLGFNLFEKALVQTCYETYKVISHCVTVYGDTLLSPMFHELDKKSRK